MARSKKPAPATHAPSGDFARPAPVEGLTCRCGAALTRVSNEASDPAHLDWAVRDERGHTFVDTTPTLRYTNGTTIDMHDEDAWDRLADIDPQRYSTLKAAYGTSAGGLFSHAHYVAGALTTIGGTASVPECHGKPMWAAPDGWRCREAYGEPALVPYSEPDERAA